MIKKIKKKLINLSDNRKELPPSISYYGISHKDQIKNFVNSIKGKENIKVSGKEGLKTLEVINKIYNSK